MNSIDVYFDTLSAGHNSLAYLTQPDLVYTLQTKNTTCSYTQPETNDRSPLQGQVLDS